MTVPGERRLAPVSTAFALFGLFSGGWAVSTVELEHALHLSNAGFGLLLSLSLVGATAGNAAGGPASERWGAGRVLAAGLAGWAALLVAGAITHRPWLLALAIAGVVTAGGLVDVAMNVAASASLAATPGYLVRFHGRWNIGAAVGAALTGAMISAGLGWRPVWAGIAVAAAALAVACAGARMPAAGSGESVPLTAAWSALRREGLVAVAAAFSLAAMVEGGIDLWGVLYLRTRLESGLLVGAGGAVLAYLVAGGSRMVLGERAGRRGAAAGILAGAGTASVGIAVLATSSRAVVAAAGLVLAAGGISMCWPLFIARAAGGRDRPGAGVGAVSAAGYLGLVAGPGLVGLLTRITDLRWALVVLAGAAVTVAVVPALTARRAPHNPR